MALLTVQIICCRIRARSRCHQEQYMNKQDKGTCEVDVYSYRASVDFIG
jgi:hypothetical protein